MTTASIVQRVWNYCNTLRDDGVSYGDYVEQLTYLLLLKMAREKKRIDLKNSLTMKYLQETKPISIYSG
ncbi:MAG: type I restriction-modification system subunit M N-terminal domain-containing protein [Ignavibacteriales bacterium]|nr:type I restriction-modification system subunit M N-terminal domain-containing protein [Ignavibacteriales bacterium]